MANKPEYITDKELDKTLEEVLKSNPAFIPVIDNVVVNICYLIRLDEQGEPKAPSANADPVTIKKVSPEMRIFTRTEVDFVIIVDKYLWDEFDQNELNGTLSDVLMRIDVQKTEEGVVKKLKPYDFKCMLANVKANGTYCQPLKYLKDVLTGKLLDMAEAAIRRPAAAASAAADDDDETTPEDTGDEEEKPRVTSGPLPRPGRSKK